LHIWNFINGEQNSELEKWKRVLKVLSIRQAAVGDDENVDDKDDPQIRSQYDRNSHGYPYRSHGQWIRACYALTGCALLGFFNGWRSLTHPFDFGDFLGCYIAVRITNS
jgi:amino acid transporter